MTPRLLLVAPLVLAGCVGVAVDQATVRREADVRASGSTVLTAALSSQDHALRAEAAAAMGRTRSKSYAPALRRALRDDHPGVRREAAFALGQLWIEEPAPAPIEVVEDLIPAMADADSKTRAAAIEALGKLGPPELEAQLVRQLADWAPAVRRESAAALFRLRYLKRLTSYSSATVSALSEAFVDPDPETRWRAVYAFTRWPEPSAAEALKGAVGDELPTVRLFALRALAQLAEKAPAEPAIGALADADERVRTEAVSLLKAAKRADALSDRTLRDGSAHVRAAAADALANPEGKLALLEKLLEDRSTFVRGQAILAMAERRGDKFRAGLEKAAEQPSWWIRARSCEAAGRVGKEGLRLLDRCLQDQDVRVKAAALEALAEQPGPDADIAIAAALGDAQASIEVRGTAVEAAAKRKSPELVAALIAAYDHSQGREWIEVRESIVDAAEALAKALTADKRLSGLRARLLQDPAPSVRMKAARSLGVDVPPAPAPEPSALVSKPPEAGALVSLDTDKGVILIELASDRAPAHVASFLDLIGRGFYDGTIFHRVVPNFVAQGGDPRGSGWGDPGYSLRDEINPIKFGRGTVGMAKAGPDTGGCQLFISLVPTPHLDGRYTVFGQVVGGMDVVDRLAPGDAIRKAVVR